MVEVKGTLEELNELFGNVRKTTKSVRKTYRTGKKAAKAAKRKVTPYQRKLGKAMKALKKKHPKTPMKRLMKRAHAKAKRMK